MNKGPGPKFYFVSLGCPKNRVDSEVAAAALLAAGFSVADSAQDADVIVVNTCSFIGDARKESEETLAALCRLKRGKAAVRVVAMGCLPQQDGAALLKRFPGLDLAVGTGVVDRIPGLLAKGQRTCFTGDKFLPDRSVPRVLSQSPAFAYLKIADGCSRRCTFCAIPGIKGTAASRPMPLLIDEARALADAGVKELVLVAQDTTQYGLPGPRRLLRLLDGLERVRGIEWIRVMYVYPGPGLKPLLLRMAEEGKVVPYLDVPVQHIDDRVLKAMGRGVSARTIRGLLDSARTLCPGIALRTTVITGFPGEDDAAFRALERFVADFRFDHLGAFAFSPESGTPAANLPHPVAPGLAARRRDRIMAAQKRISRGLNRARVGSRTRVLVEGRHPEDPRVWYGRTALQAPEVDGIVVLDRFAGRAADLITVEVTGAADYDLVGRPVPA